ncbi:hypothetical protein [Sediminibacillus massiliensis]|uniref:hypothetical protein n=1 Tax=Sediminibacillus massiliensis TaxID=1926277 RepID=UPI0009887167|nr:hypothetical protein [Sediminibacillus massiliensis]
MFLREIKNLQVVSQLSLKHVEDRLFITADFPSDFLQENQLYQPYLYVTLYARGGALIKIIDEETIQSYSLTKKNISRKVYHQIVEYALLHSPQFRHLFR